MSRTDRIKVNKASILADFVAELATLCMDAHIGFSVESPRNSFLWQLPRMKVLLQHPRTQVVSFQNCMFGARRDKWTSLLTNVPQMARLAKSCDGSHEHLPWGVRWRQGWSFATASECEYPPELCQAIAQVAADFVGLPWVTQFASCLSEACPGPALSPWNA